MVCGGIFLELGIGYLKRGCDHDREGWRVVDGDGELSYEGGGRVYGGDVYDWDGVCILGLVDLIYLKMIECRYVYTVKILET